MPEQNVLDLAGLVEVSLTRKRRVAGMITNGAANSHSDVLVWKAQPEDNPSKHKEVGMADQTELEKALADLAEADTELAKHVAEIEALEKKVSDLEADLRSRDKDVQDLRRDLDRELAKNADPEEEILKGMTEPAQKAFLAQKAATERLEKRLAEADEQAKLAEIAKSFDAECGALPVKGEEFAPILKAVYGVVDEEQAKELRRVLKAGSNAIADLVKVHGATGQGHVQTNSVETEIDKLAKTRMERDGGTYEAAYAAVMSENPSLYQKYLDEQRH